MNNKLKLQMIEILLYFVIAIITLVTLPPSPILAIPFIIIISIRAIASMIEENL